MRIPSLFLAFLALAAPGLAQTPDGAALFKQTCAGCHTTAPTDGRTPPESTLRAMAPDAIVTALTTGLMRLQGSSLSEAQRRAIAAHLGNSAAAGSAGGAAAAADATACTTVPSVVDPEAGAFWNGWGAGVRNTRFQPLERARLDPASVPRLKLKWAFGFPNATAARTQPTVAGGRVLVAGDGGEVYSLDPLTGCIHWTFKAQAGVRAAITVASYSGSGSTGPFAAYFGDTRANLYAVDVLTGKQLWTRRIDDHPAAGITGAPTFYLGRLFVGVSAIGEEVSASNPKYECCKFRGSVSAIEASTGATRWKTYTIADEPTVRGKNAAGVDQYGPSGAAVWNAPTVDVSRRMIYVGTGNGYSGPEQPNMSAVIALDMNSGAVRWSFQPTRGDIWLLGCPSKTPGNNCPAELGPDFDFGASPVLATVAPGRELIIAAQKSGMAYALDPDKQGAKVWEYRAGKGGWTGGMVWGAAVDAQNAYFAVSDAQVSPAEAGGLHAVRLDNGQRTWLAPPQKPICGAVGPRCNGAQSAAVTAMPGVIFSGANDGAMRAFAADSGKVIWEFDTNREFQTVNGVKGSGGSIDVSGAVIVNGMVFFNSGAALGGRPGNVLLAFAPE
jgi:polyvinyl alcohol dehydrogenase (cytochrome)